MIMMAATQEYLTTREAAEMLGVSLRTVQLWVESGVLSAWKTAGGHRKISMDSVERTLDERKKSLARVPASSADIRKDIRVLIVEDDDGISSMLTYFFTSWSHPAEVQTARNGFEGLISLGSKKPDILITDLNMPGINGFEMLRHIKASKDYRNMPIFVITALSKEDIDNHGGVGAGVHVIYKPINLDKLEILVKKELQLSLE